MGTSCAKFCLPHLSDPRFLSTTPRDIDAKLAQMVKCSTVSVERRLASLESARTDPLNFREGFALGVKVRKLQDLFESLEAADEGGQQAVSVPVVAEEPKGKNLPTNEPPVPVQLESRASVKIKNDHLQCARKLVPHSLHDLITKDFKPWLRIRLPDESPSFRL